MTPTIVIEQRDGESDVETRVASAYGVNVVRTAAETPEEFFQAASDADGIIVGFLQIDERMLQASRWKVVCRRGAGYDNIDVAAASRLGIAVINIPDYCVEEVAEHAVSLIYAGWRRLRAANELVLHGRWNQWQEIGPVGRMSRATLGLVGAGRIGKEVARLLRPAFSRILISDPFQKAAVSGAESADLETVLAQSDVVSLHCPLTDETRGLLNANRLAAMKQGAILVNVSRGDLIDIAALPAALDIGRPGVAMLDVLPVEPPKPDSPFLRHPGLFQTPHVAWFSNESTTELRSKSAERTAAYLTGKPGFTVVNDSQIQRRRGL